MVRYICRYVMLYCIAVVCTVNEFSTTGSFTFLVDRAVSENIPMKDAVKLCVIWGIIASTSRVLLGELLINRNVHRGEIFRLK